MLSAFAIANALELGLEVNEKIGDILIAAEKKGVKSPLCASDGIDAFDLGFNLGNVIKYVLRAGRKENAGIPDDADRNAIFDLRKASDYLTHQNEIIDHRIAEKQRLSE